MAKGIALHNIPDIRRPLLAGPYQRGRKDDKHAGLGFRGLVLGFRALGVQGLGFVGFDFGGLGGRQCGV